jgi:hypothetical protein
MPLIPNPPGSKTIGNFGITDHILLLAKIKEDYFDMATPPRFERGTLSLEG